MKIESTVAEATKYGPDALEAFYTAVDNGQARLALLILVDIVKAFEEKIDELTEAKTAAPVVQQKAEEDKKEQATVKPEVKKVEQKQTALDKDSSEEN